MEQKKNSGLGIAGFILSLLGCGSFLGVIFCIIAIATSKKNNTKKGLSIAGLIIGLIWLVISFVFGFALLFSSGDTLSDEIKNMTMDEFMASCETMEYEELFRNIDKNNGKYLKFKGEIQQVVSDGEYSSEYLISVTEDEYGFWNDNIYVVLPRDYIDDKFLEDDIVTFYGECIGSYNYTSILGESIEVPKMVVPYMYLDK